MQAYVPIKLVEAIDADARAAKPVPLSRGVFLTKLLGKRYRNATKGGSHAR